MRPVHGLLVRKYYIDELYETLIVSRIFYRQVLRFVSFVDSSWIDNLNIRTALWTGHAGRILTRLQTGQVQAYGIGISFGVVVIIAVYLLWG